MNTTVQVQDRLLYLYGIVQNSPDLPAMSSTIESIVQGKLVALVESVSAAEFAPEALETQFASLEWVARHAEKHEALVEAAMQHGPVIPARFCTLFSNDEAVRKVLADDEERLWGTLARLDGMAEWSIRVYCDAKELERVVAERDAKCSALAEMAAVATPGQAYVLTQRRQGHIMYLADARKSALQEVMLDELYADGFETQAKRLPAAAPGPQKTEMVANIVVLASKRTLPRLYELFEGLERRYAADGFTFERTGPWPPYSFTQHDDALDDDDDWEDEGGVS